MCCYLNTYVLIIIDYFSIVLDWTVVQFIEDQIFYMCPSKSMKSTRIGKTCMVKWMDKKLYLAKILKHGSMLFLIFNFIFY